MNIPLRDCIVMVEGIDSDRYSIYYVTNNELPITLSKNREQAYIFKKTYQAEYIESRVRGNTINFSFCDDFYRTKIINK